MSGMCSAGVPADWPDTGAVGNGCCMGSAVYGPERCTCWIAVYDQTQARPRTDLPSGCQTEKCGTCAFRPGSPERTGYAKSANDYDDLLRLVEEGHPFWCHEGSDGRPGMLAPVAYLHPPSMTWYVVTDDMAFHPPRRLDDHGTPTPYLADGTPGLLCAGWAALRLHRLQKASA